MIETVFAITLIFTDWDECWNTYARLKPDLSSAEILEVCDALEYYNASVIATSPRPRYRP